MRSEAALLLRMAWRTARLEPWRVFLPAVLVFGADAFATTGFTELSADHLGYDSLASFAVLIFTTMGLTFYSGLLEGLVGAMDRGELAPPVWEVMRSLPWVRLLVAEGVLWVVSTVASLAVVVPDVIVVTLFVLVGPLINMEDITLLEACRRSAQLVAPHFRLVLLLITLPLGVEHEVVETVRLLVPSERWDLVFGSNLVLGLLFGVAIGLVEVALAEHIEHGAGSAHTVDDEEGLRHAGDDSRNGDAGVGDLPGAG
jgi:hypothetical protein